MTKKIRIDRVLDVLTESKKSQSLERAVELNPSNPILMMAIDDIYDIRGHLLSGLINYKNFKRPAIMEMFQILDKHENRGNEGNPQISYDTLLGISAETNFRSTILRSSPSGRINRVVDILTEKNALNARIPRPIDTIKDSIACWKLINGMQQERNVGKKTLDDIRHILESALSESLTSIAHQDGCELPKIIIDVESASDHIYHMNKDLLSWLNHRGIEKTALDIKNYLDRDDVIISIASKKKSKRLFHIDGLKHIPIALSQRNYNVLERRYGLNGKAETLSEIAETTNISRERIRQIHMIAIKSLSEPTKAKMRHFVCENKDSVISNITEGRHIIKEERLKLLDRVNFSHRGVPGYFSLAIDAGYGGFTKWADVEAIKFEGFYIFDPLKADIAEIQQLYREIVDFKLSNQRVEYIEKLRMERNIDRAYLEIVTSIIGEHDPITIAAEGPGKAKKYKMAVWDSAQEIGNGGPVNSIRLASDYMKIRHKTKEISPNSALKGLKDWRRFIHIYGHIWMPIPEARLADTSGFKQFLDAGATARNGENRIWSHEAQTNGATGALHRKIESNGPIFEMHRGRNRSEIVGERIGLSDKIILKTNPNFITLSPHLFGVCADLGKYLTMSRDGLSKFVSTKVIRIYVENKKCGGEPDLYPIWTNPEWEIAMLNWAINNGDVKSANNLVDANTIDSIQAPDQFVPPAADRFIALMIHLWWRRQTSWVPASRVAHNMMNQRIASSHLATLVKLGLAHAPDHWGMPHTPSTKLADSLDRILRDMHNGLAPSWGHGHLGELLSNADNRSSGWVKKWKPVARHDASIFWSKEQSLNIFPALKDRDFH